MPSEPAALPEATPDQDDGILQPKDVCDKIGALLWAHRDSIEVTLDYNEIKPNRGRHSSYPPRPQIRLPGGVTVSLRPDHSYGITLIIAPDGQIMEIEPGYDGRILNVFRSIQTLAIVEDLSLQDIFPSDIEDDGTEPCANHSDRLAKAIGAFVERQAPFPCTEAYLYVYDEGNPQEVPETVPSIWTSLGQDILLRVEENKSAFQSQSKTTRAYISHPKFGVIVVDGDPIRKGLDRRKSASLAAALGMALEIPAPLPMPRGNAKAARVLRLCREAVAAEPDLADANGTPIRPLVDQHLPELMRRHAAASAIAPMEELDAIDAELMEGIDRVRKAVDEALACSAVARRSALRTQLRFLELRHPDAVPLLEPISESSSL